MATLLKDKVELIRRSKADFSSLNPLITLTLSRTPSFPRVLPVSERHPYAHKPVFLLPPTSTLSAIPDHSLPKHTQISPHLSTPLLQP